MKKEHKILIVDDEPDILELLVYNFEKEGYVIKTASNGIEAVQEYKTFLPEVIIMDIIMSEMDGIEACRRIVELAKSKPHIIFLTARHEEYIELATFDAGGSDFLMKPIKIRALLKRINLVFADRENIFNTYLPNPNDHRKTSSKLIKVKNVVINKDSYTVYKNAQKIMLPRKDFEILCLLSENTNKVFSREDIIKKVWITGANTVTGRTVDVHIRKIRERMGDDFINTIVGIGYIIEV